MAENQVYLIKSGQNSFVEETEAIVGISGGKVGIGTTAPEADLHVTGSVKIGGDLAVDGTFTTINSSTISVDDKNIELGSTDNPTDVTADGGGITVKGTTDKTFNWIDATDAWTSSEHLHLAAGKSFAADAIRALGAGGLNIGDDAGNGIFVQDGGKVGIATTNPGYDLDVDGSGNFASLYVDGNAVLTGEGSIFGKWEDGAAQGEIFYTGGNVGVGTNNPEYPLHVFGNSVVDGNFVVNGTSGNFNVSDFNVSGDSIVLNYGGGSLTSNRGGIIVKDSSFANKTFEYVEGSDYWNSNVGLNITNGGINVASVSAVDANGLTLGDDAGNGIFVEDGGQIGINTTSPGYNLHVNGSTHVGGEFSVGNEFKISAGGAVGGTAPASDGDIIKWDDANSKWVAGANVGGGGGGGVGEVPLATINSLPSGQSIYEIEFAETYNVEPRIATQLEIDGEGSIIPYVVSGVSTSGYHLIFAQDIPNNNYRIHTTFGGRDVHWETGAGASLYYNDGDVSIQRNFTIGGNLTVNGTTTTVNTETVEIEDHNLVIAANTGYNQLTNEYPGAGGAYAGILWGTGDAGAASPVSLTYQTNKGFAFEGGNVGIGTTNPGVKLDIQGNSNLASKITLTRTDVGRTAVLSANADSPACPFVGSQSNSDFAIYTNNSAKMLIDTNGNVGIGTTSPSAALHVDSSLDGPIFDSGGTGNTNHALLVRDSAKNQLLRVNNNGNVGIGTTNPSGNLHISTSKTYADPYNYRVSPLLKIENTANAEPVVITFVTDDSSANNRYGNIIFHPSGTQDASYFAINANIRDANHLVVKGNGNVGIGTTNPTRTLHILDATNDGSGGIKVQNYKPVIELSDATTNATATTLTQDNTNFVIANNNVDALAIKSNGNVGIGTTNPSAKLHVSTSNTLISGTVSIVNSSTLNASGSKFLSELSVGDSLRIEGGSTYTVVSINSDTQVELNSNITAGGGESLYRVNTKELLHINEKTKNVGIGTTNPGSLLEIKKDVTSGLGPVLNLTNYGGSYYCQGAINFVEGGQSIRGQIRFETEPGANIGSALYYGTRSADGGVDDIFVIKNNGNVGIGTTNPGSNKLYVNGNIYASGTITPSSDDRVKHNEQAIVGAIETLGKLTPKKYIKTTEMYEANHDFELDADGNPVDANGEPVEHSIEAGVIAQQVLEVPELAFMVSPEGVDEDGNVTSPHGLNYNSLFTYAIAAIQEQQSIIEDLKSQNASLESRISALES